MSFETLGTLHKVFDTENKTASFQAREFVIRHDGNYPQFIKFQLTQDRCDMINAFKEGDFIKVSFDLRGREWNDKYFTNLNAWRIDAAQNPVSENAESTPQGEFNPIGENLVESSSGSDDIQLEDFGDLPF
jgi:hypothetical protein